MGAIGPVSKGAGRARRHQKQEATTMTKANRRTPARDPIFAAIENHRKLNKALHALWEARDVAESEARTKHGRRPRPLIDWHNCSGLGASGIERVKDDMRLSGVDPETIETEYWEARARLLGAEAAGKEWDKRAGLATLRREVDRA